MIKKLLFILFVLGSINCHAQIALKGLLFMPRGEFGAVMKKKFTGEIMYMAQFDGHWRARAGLAYLNLKPRLDTFPVVGVISDGSGTRVVPGYQVYHRYDMIYLFVGYDFRFSENFDLSPYIGLDLLIGGTNEKYDEYYPQIEEGSNSVGQMFGGIRLRAGAEYSITDHLGVFLDLSSAGYLVTESGFFGHLEAGLGLHYVFNPD